MSVLKHPLWLFLGLIVVLAILGLVETDQVVRGTGRLMPQEEIWITTSVETPILSIPVREGQEVALGDTLVILKDDLAKSRLALAEMKYERTVAEREAAREAIQVLQSPPQPQEIGILENELAIQREKLLTASRHLERTRVLISRGGLVSSIDYEKAVSDSVLAAANTGKAFASLELRKKHPITPILRKTQFEFEAADAAAAQARAQIDLAKQELSRYSIRSPKQARVAKILATPGIVPSIGDTLLLLASGNYTIAESRLPAEHGPWIRPGQSVKLSPSWDDSHEFPGEVISVRKYVEEGNNPSVLVRVKLSSPHGLIYGSRLTIEISLRRASILELIFHPFDWPTASSSTEE